MLRDYLVHLPLFSRNARLFLTGAFFFGFGFGTFWVLLNLYLREAGLSESEIGRVLSFQSLGALLSAPLVPWLTRRFRFRTLLMGAAAVSTVAYAGLSLGTGPALLYPASALAGAGFSAHLILSAPFFMRNSGPRERIYLFGVSWSVEMLAGVIATGLSGGLAARLAESMDSSLLGLRVTLLLATALVSLAIVPYSLLRRAPPPEEKEPQREPPRRGTLLRLSTPAFLVGCGSGLVIPFLNLYFRDRFSVSTDGIGALFAVGQALTAVGFLMAPVLARRIGMIRTVVAVEIASIPFFLAMAFTQDLRVAALAFWMRGALMNMNHPISTNFAMELVGRERQAFTNSVLMVMWNGSWMVSTQIGGILIERNGFTLPMLLTVGVYLLSSILYLVFFDGVERGWRKQAQTSAESPS